MARLKRLAAPTFMPVERKTAKYVVSSTTGSNTIPLAVIVRDSLKYAKTFREASQIIKSGQVLVDGVVRKDPSYGAGLMDVVSIDYKNFRIVPTKKGLALTEIDEKEAKTKLVRINGKVTISGGKTQINLHDGSSMIHDQKIATKDVLVVSLPERKITKTLHYTAGNLAVVTLGRNAGTVGVIKQIENIRGTSANKVYLEVNNETVEFPEDYIFVVGEKDLQITATKSE